MHILSFDCAYKTLGVVHVYLYDDYRNYFENLKNNILFTIKKVHEINKIIVNLASIDVKSAEIREKITQLDVIIQHFNALVDCFDVFRRDFFRVLYAEVVDVLPEKKLKSVAFTERLRLLIEALGKISEKLPIPDVVLIEYQMSANDASREASHGICSFYANKAPVISLTASNKFSLNIPGITYADYVSRYRDKYEANKAFATAIGTYILTISENAHNHVTSHVSDALILIIAYMSRMSQITRPPLEDKSD